MILQIPEGSPGGEPGREWKSVPVQIVKDKLVVDNGKWEINLRPEKGSVYIHGAVAYSELSHTSAFDQPHVFKIGHSRGSRVREARYFMAKTFQEKAAWIEALEKVALLSGSDEKESSDQDELMASPSKALADWDVVGTFPAENVTVFCAVALADGDKILFGTSQVR